MTPSSSGAHSEESNRKASIHKLLLCEEVDLAALRAHSREVGGYIDNELRSRVWPKLLGINRFEIPDYREYVKSHKDFHQVQLDVERSLWYHDHILDWPESLRVRRRKALSDIIMAVLCRNPNFNYYQVMDELICSFFLFLVIGCALEYCLVMYYYSDLR